MRNAAGCASWWINAAGCASWWIRTSGEGESTSGCRERSLGPSLEEQLSPISGPTVFGRLATAQAHRCTGACVFLYVSFTTSAFCLIEKMLLLLVRRVWSARSSHPFKEVFFLKDGSISNVTVRHRYILTRPCVYFFLHVFFLPLCESANVGFLSLDQNNFRGKDGTGN